MKTSLFVAVLMDHWKIIGWAVITVVCCFAIALAATILAGVLIARAKRKIALNTPPAKGQVWKQDGKWLRITSVENALDGLDGKIVRVRTENASWCESVEQWKKRVRNRNLTLETS